jgi:hypothetical protein
MVFAAIVGLVELISLFIKAADLSFLCVGVMVVTLYYVLQHLIAKYHWVGGLLFPVIEKGGEGESNRIYPLLPFCQRVSHLSSIIVDGILCWHKRNLEGNALWIAGSSLISVALAVFFLLAGSFWPIYVIVHVILFAPGAVMHPIAWPYTKPWVIKFAHAVKCPYCKE